MKEFLKKEFTTLIVLVLPYLYLALIWNKLPEQIPSHFNINGEIDGYSSKMFFPMLNLGLYFLLLVLPKIDPKKLNYEKFSGTYSKLRFFIISFFSGITILVYQKALAPEINIIKYISILMFLLFLIIGNYLSTLKPNWFVGIRTPWTMDNEIVWRKTHFIASKLWFFGSLLGLILVLSVNTDYINFILTLFVLTMVIIPVIYSFIIFRKLKENK